MPHPKRLVYIWSLRNAAADRAGRLIAYKQEQRYMSSVLEYLAGMLDGTPLGDAWSLQGVIFDDDAQSPRDQAALEDYGFAPRPGHPWLFPEGLSTQGRRVADLLCAVPSTYRRLPREATAERAAGKRDFERRLLAKLTELRADLVVLDGLLVILDELVRPGAPFYRRITNIHPGITRIESPYERRGAHATLDALHGAQGRKVIDWNTLETRPVPVKQMTGASFHYVDNGIDSGEVITDLLNTPIDPQDTILELRWNNFHRSLFPALRDGLALLAGEPGAGIRQPSGTEAAAIPAG